MEILGAELTPQEAEVFLADIYADLQLHHPLLVGVANWVEIDLIPTIMKPVNRRVFDISMNVKITLPDGESFIMAYTDSVREEAFHVIDGFSPNDIVHRSFKRCIYGVVEELKPRLIMVADKYRGYWQDVEDWVTFAIDLLPTHTPQESGSTMKAKFAEINIFQTHAYRHRWT